MNKLISEDISRCSNHSCIKRNRCCRFMQLEIDKEEFKKVKHKSISVTRFEEKNCKMFIEFDDHN